MDWIIGPIGFLVMLEMCQPLCFCEKLQIILDMNHWDHIGVMAQLSLKLLYLDKQKQNQIPAWDNNVIAKMLNNDQQLQMEMIADIETALQQQNTTLMCMTEDTALDKHWDTFMQILQKIALQHCSNKKHIQHTLQTYQRAEIATPETKMTASGQFALA